MKNMFIIILIAILGISGCSQENKTVQATAGEQVTVELTKCIDGDTATFTKVGTTRFLYIDTPESTRTVEPYGKEAAAYTCNLLKSANEIQLQYDGPKKDKYDRTLAWIWIDGKLLQREIIKKGYVEKFYDYGTYSYEAELRDLQANAERQKVGLWSSQSGTTPKPTNKKIKEFENCTDLRKVYPNGVPKNHTAYESNMDRDHDGFACER
ncbi:thermonuclease family protein [Bacillus sp. JJ664]